MYLTTRKVANTNPLRNRHF